MQLDAIAALEDLGAAARLGRSELGEIVRTTLAQVSPQSREVRAPHYLAGYSAAELAVAFGVSPGRKPHDHRYPGRWCTS
jgi:DNA-directed RNA polymerase specialized sigma24 family protein